MTNALKEDIDIGICNIACTLKVEYSEKVVKPCFTSYKGELCIKSI